MKISIALFFAFLTTSSLKSQITYSRYTEDYESVKTSGLNVVYWSDDPDVQDRIDLAFKKYYTFSDVNFIDAKRDNFTINSSKIYLMKFSFGDNTHDLSVVKGKSLNESGNVNVASQIVSVAYDGNIEMNPGINIPDDLTEIYVIKLNFALNFALTHNISLLAYKALWDNKKHPEKLLGKTLLIPEDYIQALEKENIEAYKYPYKIIKSRHIKDYLESEDAFKYCLLTILDNQGFNSIDIFDFESKQTIYQKLSSKCGKYMKFISKQLDKADKTETIEKIETN